MTLGATYGSYPLFMFKLIQYSCFANGKFNSNRLLNTIHYWNLWVVTCRIRIKLSVGKELR